jgi:hypothetical protein
MKRGCSTLEFLSQLEPKEGEHNTAAAKPKPEPKLPEWLKVKPK